MQDQPTTEVAASDPTVNDAYKRKAQIYPILSDEMTERIAQYGQIESVTKGQMLFTRGDRTVDFFLVLEGAIEIYEGDDAAPEHVVTVHRAHQFTGEVDLLNDRMILVSGRAIEDSRVVRVPRPDLKRLVTGETDIAEIMMRAFILRRVGLIQHGQGGVLVIGANHNADTLRIQRFLTRNGYPHRLLDTEVDPDAEGFLVSFNVQPDQLPVVVTPDDVVRHNPTTGELADLLGLTEELDPSVVFDIAIVGAGPAGLAAAVYAASEGLSTIVIEGLAPGGQAGTSSKIENYLGFPTGISGQALAGRAQVQAQKFGARLAISRHAARLECEGRPFVVALEDGQSVRACSVVIATGARYRKLDVENYSKYEGQGIHYAATAMEQVLCGKEEVIVVGGGNSAGQAAVFLARTSAHVHIMVRADGLAETMSDYLVQRIENNPNITLHTHTEITALDGDDRLRSVTWTNRETGETQTKDIGNVFIMIGAEPNTSWLDGCLDLDAKGFIITGRDKNGQALASPYATTRPGLFAIGDVRSGSVKRVASSVGEGSVVIQAVHQFLNPGVA